MIRSCIDIVFTMNQQHWDSQRSSGSGWIDCVGVKVSLFFGHTERPCDKRTRQKPGRSLCRDRPKVGERFRRDHAGDSVVDGRALNRHGGAE